MLTMIDEYIRKCLTIHYARRIRSIQAIDQLANAMIIHGIPKYVRSDNDPEFIAKELRSWLSGIGVKTACIGRAVLGKMAFVKPLTIPLEITFYMEKSSTALKEAQIIIGEWVKHYNHVMPHSVLGYRPPAPQTKVHQLM